MSPDGADRPIGWQADQVLRCPDSTYSDSDTQVLCSAMLEALVLLVVLHLCGTPISLCR